MALNRIGTYLSSSEQNTNQVRLEASAESIHGRGVISGMTMTDAGSGVASISTGVYHILGSSYVTTTLTYTIPASSTVSLWIDENGTLSHTTSTTDSGDLVCLGRITRTGSTLTITENGRNYLLRTSSTTPGVYKIGTGIYFDGPNTKLGIGTTTPTNNFEVAGTSLLANTTVGGTLGVTGAVSLSNTLTSTAQIPTPTNVQTLTSDKTLVKGDANLQIITASGANRKVILPATLDWGTHFTIANVGTSNNVLVRDSADSATVCTLAPGELTKVSASVPSGGGSSPIWPTSTTPSSGVLE